MKKDIVSASGRADTSASTEVQIEKIQEFYDRAKMEIQNEAPDEGAKSIVRAFVRLKFLSGVVEVKRIFGRELSQLWKELGELNTVLVQTIMCLLQTVERETKEQQFNNARRHLNMVRRILTALHSNAPVELTSQIKLGAIWGRINNVLEPAIKRAECRALDEQGKMRKRKEAFQKDRRNKRAERDRQQAGIPTARTQR